MNYHDRQRITESLDTSGLLKLCELSVDGGFEHQPPEKLSEYIHSYGPHLINERWCRDMNKGARVPPFYGLSVYARRITTEEHGKYPDSSWEDSPDREPTKFHPRPSLTDPANNKHSTDCIAHGTIRFEVPIEPFHETVLYSVTVFPELHVASELSAKKNPLRYQQLMTKVRQGNMYGDHDSYIAMVDPEQLKAEGKLWKRGSWGMYLKHNMHDYGDLLS